MELTVGEETAQNIPFTGIFGEQGLYFFSTRGLYRKERKEPREREGTDEESARHDRKADPSNRW